MEGRGEGVQEYNLRKEEVVRGVLGRAFEGVGLLDEGGEGKEEK